MLEIQLSTTFTNGFGTTSASIRTRALGNRVLLVYGAARLATFAGVESIVL